jgi:hypothetical protein
MTEQIHLWGEEVLPKAGLPLTALERPTQTPAFNLPS